ncbi:MAG: HAD hydrolase-like protein [Selenomonadaceae bacterium]|nr:HAD hydrolase-like protein [Selenomonadaceae bacterium]
MINNILFDFDGTLVDTRDGIVKSMHYAYDCMGYERLSDEKIRAVIGPPLQDMFRQLAGVVDDAEIEKCVRFFRERYRKSGVSESELYPYVQEGLTLLKNHGKRLFIVSSKPEIFINQIGNRYDIIGLFDEISAAPAVGKVPPKSLRIENMMKKYEMSSEDTVMAGDRHEDAEAAASNYIRCIGAVYGYDSKSMLQKFGCWKLCDSFREICDVILA